MTSSSVCCCWVLSSNNHIYPLTIHTRYYDGFHGFDLQLREPDYTVGAYTTVEEVNSCGEFRYVENRRQQPTDQSANAVFDFFTTIEPEGSGNPLTRLETRAPDVGITTCWSCGTMSLVWQEPTSQTYSYSGSGTTRIESTYGSGAPYGDFFRWNDALKEYKRRTPAEGVNSAYTDFKAAYDSAFTGIAAFSPNGSGFAFYGNGGQWIERWVIAHETGHHLQYALQENVMTFGGAHTICGLHTATGALGEGFADWYGCFYETERREWYFNCENGECYSTCPAGYLIEGNVATFLWDVFDGVNHATHDQGVDTVWYSQSILNDWANEYADFPTFYEDYRARGIWGDGEPVVDQLRTVNQVHVPQ